MLRIIGIGNILRGDDGIGPYIIKELEKENLPDCIELIDIGSDAFSIIDYFAGKQPVLVLDCAQMGESPGKIIKFEVKDNNLSILDKAISIHGFGFSDVYKMALSLYESVPCTVIGIQPKSIEFNTGLSNEVRQKVPSIIKMVIEETNKYVKKNNHN